MLRCCNLLSLPLHSLSLLHNGLLRCCCTLSSFCFFRYLIELCFCLSLDSIRKEICKFFKKVWMICKQHRHLFENFFNTALLLLICMQDLQELFVRLRLVCKTFLNCCHVVDGVVEFERRLRCTCGRRCCAACSRWRLLGLLLLHKVRVLLLQSCWWSCGRDCRCGLMG